MSFLDSNGLQYFWNKINNKLATKEELSMRAKAVSYTATIPTSGWSSTTPYYLDIVVEGLSENDSPTITPIYTGTLATDQARQEAWNKIDRVVANNDSIRVYAFEEKPSVEIPINIQAITNGSGDVVLSGGVEQTVLWEGNLTTSETSVTLNENVENFDYILIGGGYCNASGSARNASMSTFRVTDIKSYGYGTTHEYQLIGMGHNKANTAYILTSCYFENATQVKIKFTVEGELYPYVSSVIGIKCNASSDGIDTKGIKVLEASDSNIVDFNALTEEGFYIIKNATTSTTTNGPSLGTSGNVLMEVGSKSGVVYQSIMTITNNGIPYHRQCSSGTWSSWLSTIATNVIRAGTLNSGMSCNTPTANTHIANKKYVDDAIASAITAALGGS